MVWVLIASALAAIVMATAGLGVLVPVGHVVADFCEFGAVGLAMVFVGLSDGV